MWGGPWGPGASSCVRSPNTGESFPLPPRHRQRRPHTLLGSLHRDPPGTGVSRGSCLCPRRAPQCPSPSRIPPCSSISGWRIHKIRGRGGERDTPLLQLFFAAFARSNGERAMSQEPCGPRDPLWAATVSPASGITSPAGEDRAGSPSPLERRHPAGAWPQGAAARRPPRPHARCPAKTWPRCQAPSPARGRARCGPAQPSVAPLGTAGTRKSCWKRTSLSRLGQRAPAPASPALHPCGEGSKAWRREPGWEPGCSAPLTGVPRG